MSRRRMAWMAAALASLLLTAAVAILLIAQSRWFYERVRQRIVSTVETATGGRVEAGSFDFDWKRLRAELRDFTIHGAEPADKPPLFHAASIEVGLKIVSVLKRAVDVQYLEVSEPRIYLVIYPDGHTNVPAPRVKARNARNPAEVILNLAIGRFNLHNGIFEIESRGGTPFDARGQNLNAKVLYDLAGPRYRGDISIQPLDVHWGRYGPMPLGVTMAVSIERNRIGIASASLTTGDSRIDFSGALEDLLSPRGSFRYDARVAIPDVARVVGEKSLEAGTVQLGGSALWAGAAHFSVTGNLHAYGFSYRDSHVLLRDFRADGAIEAGPHGMDVSGLRLSGAYVNAGKRVPVDGRVHSVALGGSGLEARGVALAALGGSFQGEVRILDFDRYRVKGEVSGVEARPTVAVYSREPLPWDALASGAVWLEGSLRRPLELRAGGNLTLSPAPESAAVHGQINATYEARGKILDLGRSTLALPSSRADFSGSIGREMRVHLETRDLNDLLPALGESAARLPVKLQNGLATFNGTVTGNLEHPHIAGHANATSFSYSGETFDSLQADVTASPENLRLQNAGLARGPLRAQFQLSLGLREWKTAEDSAIAGSGTIRNAGVTDLAALLNLKSLPVTGTLNAAGKVAGTLAGPVAEGDVDVSKGTLRDEPFDRFTAHVNYGVRTLQVASGQLTAGAKQVRLSATYDHAPDRFDAGRLRFDVTSNALRLDQIETLKKSRPGLAGTAQVAANGDLNIAPSRGGQPEFRISDLHADVAARGLELSGQPLGNARLTANSAGQVLRAHLESDFANSAVRGDGEWRLEGDYPGSARVTFSKLDFAQLRDWIAPSKSGAAARFAGFAEGELRVDGPALDWEKMKAELRLPNLEIGPAPNPQVAQAGLLTLRNSGPIVARMANSTITLESARLAGRSTDLAVTGKIATRPAATLDLRVNGRIDLAILKDFNPDIASSGTVVADAVLRGPPGDPQLNGRMELQNLAFSLADFPNGISKGSGVVLFTGDRAMVQSFTGETGGGQIALSGFADYRGDPMLFRLHADAREVRIRYPEGVSTVANANLNLTGTSDRSMLLGTVTILRTGFNPQSDFSSLLARSAEPVRTPSARTGPLGGLNFDIQIETAPDIQVQSTLTQDIQVAANLQLRGTVSNPALLGRINITQGQVFFFGTRYTIDQGSIAFYNPVKVEPILDVDLGTKARGIDITLTISGPLNKLNLTPRSDPPLEFSEIVGLLATGRTPTSDPTLLAQQSSSPQAFQQMGASALLGQAIASPVAGRLQRFFGVSQLRIDPTLPGVENNPQARITLEQQVTPDITFTYITNVTSSNPQVVRVEWSVSKQWSVVLLREENGLTGVDFFFKKQFK